jgi:hypothetical protein
MKFPLVSALVVGAALAQVGASPARLEVAKIPDDVSSRIRYGHAFAPNNADFSRIQVATIIQSSGPSTTTKVRAICNSMKARLEQKAAEISGAFKQALGLPQLTRIPPPAPGMVHILPIGRPSFVSFEPAPPIPIFVPEGYPHHHGSHRPGSRRPGCMRKTSFFQRIHIALTTLGPWEGRSVAFVLGCGIGVLLRMFWVLAVVSYRAIKCTNDDDNEYTEIVFVEEVEELPAPAYTASDEKAEIATPEADGKV